MADRPALPPAVRMQRAQSWSGGVISFLLAASVAALAGTPAMNLVVLAFMLVAGLSAAAAHYQVSVVRHAVEAGQVEDAVMRALTKAAEDGALDLNTLRARRDNR